MAKKSKLLLFAKTSFQTSFSDIFFRFQPSLTTIFNVFSRCNHRNDFITTISDGCNSRCKRSSSTIFRPGLLESISRIRSRSFISVHWIDRCSLWPLSPNISNNAAIILVFFPGGKYLRYKDTAVSPDSPAAFHGLEKLTNFWINPTVVSSPYW